MTMYLASKKSPIIQRVAIVTEIILHCECNQTLVDKGTNTQ